MKRGEVGYKKWVQSRLHMHTGCVQVKAEFTVPANVSVCMHTSVQTWSREGFSPIVHALRQNPTCALSRWYMRLSRTGHFSLF